MQIQHNIAALTTSRQQGINSTNFKKTSEKLASGYKINRAADDAAGLSISEKLRWQVRGLKRSIENAEEGANFIQVADGAMSEIHSMLHRMRELAVQSLNDTNTPDDRAAMAAEFEQLQCEIDSINTETDYNTQPVFERYTDSYYKIYGNRKWTANQIHSIEAPDNSLHVNLPADLYDPADYTITVPNGNYTTQELIDEIEDAFLNMADPSNPGLSLEFTKDGFCDLVFQSEDGEPTEINTVDGHLAYLIYDNYMNNTSASLLGTTQFDLSQPYLTIAKDHNDTLSFRVETRDGKLSEQINITIPPGKYDRTQMIDLLNDELKKHPETTSLVAKPYGDTSIQITGGTTASITSLKGNMFNIEDKNVEDVYTSVFYDNICSGISTSSAPYIRGSAYYNKDYTTPIKISSANKNNQLAFSLKPSSTKPEYIIDIPDGDYVINNNMNDPNNLVGVLNNYLQAATGGVVSAQLGTTSQRINGQYHTVNYITLASSKACNSVFNFQFPASSDPSNPVTPDESAKWKNTYDTLFRITNYSYIQDPYKTEGNQPTNASLTGSARLTMPVTLKSQSLTVKVNGTDYNLTIPNTSYSSIDQLTGDIDKALKANPSFPDSLKDKITVAPLGNRITINASDGSISSIDVERSGDAYEQLFADYGESAIYEYKYDYGNESYKQGSTALDQFNPAKVTMDHAIPNDQTVIDATNNNFQIYLNNSYVSVYLDHGTYSREALIEELNKKLSAYPVTASLDANRLHLESMVTGSDHNLNITVNSNNGTIWKALLGTEERVIPPSATPYSPGSPTSYQGIYEINPSVTLNDANNHFTIKTTAGDTVPIQLDKDKPYTKEELRDAINTQLNSYYNPTGAKPGDEDYKRPFVEASVMNGCIRLSAISGGRNTFSIDPMDDTSFYKTVLGKENTSKTEGYVGNYRGTHTYTEPFIVGRQDMVNGEITIIAGVNDKFTVDLNYRSRTTPVTEYTKELTCTIPPGTYTYDASADPPHGITDAIEKAFQAQLDLDPKTDGLEIDVSIGTKNTSVTGANDKTAMVITIKEAEIEDPDNPGQKIKVDADPGTYTIDGVRGSASYFTFYKTTGSLEPSYVIGVQDITKGVDLGPDNNELILTVDGKDYKYVFPPDPNYTADMITDFLNAEFKKDPVVPLNASVEDGKLKIAYDILGPHEIINISGSAKGDLFFKERGRETVDAFMLQVSANAFDGLELPRLRVGTLALGINSVTVSKTKNANKALVRLDRAIDLLSSKRSTYGALQNRIEHIVCNNGIAVENQQASESRIRDANMALEMIEYVKHQILMQASDAMLAQANQLPNIVLNLLR